MIKPIYTNIIRKYMNIHILYCKYSNYLEYTIYGISITIQS